MSKICSFFGHRETLDTEALLEKVRAEVEKAAQSGCRVFYFGGFGGFDSLCLKVVTELKEANPTLGIKRVVCVLSERELVGKSRLFRRDLYDEAVYLTPSFDYWYSSIYYRNLAMVDASDYVIFYAERREGSGAYKTYKYAVKQKGKIISNLY